MHRIVLFLAFLAAPWTPLSAQTPSDRLDAVAVELEGIVADLEASQLLTASLRDRLADLESLADEHRASLIEQDRRLADYRTTVATLEAHDAASLSLAQELKGQLETERRLGAWLWPVAGVAVAVAVVEAVALGWRR